MTVWFSVTGLPIEKVRPRMPKPLPSAPLVSVQTNSNVPSAPTAMLGYV